MMKYIKKGITFTILLFEVLVISSCGIVISDQRLKVTHLALDIDPVQISLLSFHGRYVTAMDETDSWAIRQEPDSKECGWFTLEYLANGKIVLKTCNDRYVTAPDSGDKRQDWMLRQEINPSNCSEFDLYELGDGKVALKTCAGKFITAGDDGLGWEGELEWAIVGETDMLADWEIFTLEKK